MSVAELRLVLVSLGISFAEVKQTNHPGAVCAIHCILQAFIHSLSLFLCVYVYNTFIIVSGTKQACMFGLVVVRT